MNWNDLFRETALEDVGLAPALLNLGLVLILGQILAWHYLRFSPVLSNKRKLARVFVFIAATTMLVISVVKTSLALSLGLVGALSIIRFRTPIKEPEELAYLFLSIGIGIGLGADQRLITIVMFAGILGYLSVIGMKSSRGLPPRLLVHVSSNIRAEDDGAEQALRDLLAQVESGASRVDLRRVDRQGGELNATLVLDLDASTEIGTLLTRIEKALPGGSVSIVEGGSLD